MSRPIVVLAAVLAATIVPSLTWADTSEAPAAPASTAAVPVKAVPVKDVMERPSTPSPLAAKKLLTGMARAGDSYVAVGPRGHIVYSSDGGKTWTQASVPVSSDLTAVWFASATHGWAVGHDGIVLNTTDGGKTWARQFDGRAAVDIMLQDLQAKLAASPDSEELKALVTEAERDKEAGPDKPFLDVWFESETTGYIVGAYNLIFATTDGGKTWQPWFDRLPNPQFMSLYSIRPVGGDLYIAGEGGVVFRLDRTSMRFVPVPVDYPGSLFGVVDAGGAVLTYAIKGRIYRSADSGTTWTPVESGLRTMIVAGATLGPGSVLFAAQNGDLAASKDGGLTFTPVKLPTQMPLTNMIDAGSGKLGLTGPFGVAVVAPAP